VAERWLPLTTAMRDYEIRLTAVNPGVAIHSVVVGRSTSSGWLHDVTVITAWASAHRGQMGSADPPGKMDEKLKSETMQKEQFSEYLESNRASTKGRCRERRYADHILIQIYSRMHHFAVKFSKFS